MFIQVIGMATCSTQGINLELGGISLWDRSGSLIIHTPIDVIHPLDVPWQPQKEVI